MLLVTRSGAPFAAIGAILLIALGFALVCERLAPYQLAWNASRGDRARDTVHLVVNESLVAISLAGLPLIADASVMVNRAFWPARWPWLLQILFALLVFDLGITFAHHASHRADRLWRFHAVHHSVRRMYCLNGILKHPVHQAIEMAAGTAPLVLLGLPRDIALALASLTALQLLAQHANVDVVTGPFRCWYAGPELHRLHHRRQAGLGDVNFGLFTTLGDRLLGTLDDGRDQPVRSDDLGLEGDPDYPVDWVSQMSRPFRSPRVWKPLAPGPSDHELGHSPHTRLVAGEAENVHR